MGSTAIKYGLILAMTCCVMADDEEDSLGTLNANPAFIDSVSNESGTKTGDFSTRSLLGPTENAQWQLDGPVVVDEEGQVLGRLSTVDVSTSSLFNETILEQVPFEKRSEACIGSINDSFSTEGPKIYDSQSETFKEKLKEVRQYESLQR